MKLNFKITGLLLSITLVLIISSILYYVSQVKEEKLYNIAFLENTSVSINSILKSRQRALNQALEDNSAWDMMVDFASKPDSLWAEENLNTMRQTMNLDFVEVYNIKHSLVWSDFQPDTRSGLIKEFTKEQLQHFFSTAPIVHFFEKTDLGLLEVFGSIIVPSTDIERKTKARGFLFIGKLWDKEVFSDLENSCNSTISFQYLPETEQNNPEEEINENSHEIPVYVKDYQGKDLAKLDLSSKSFFKVDSSLFYMFTLLPFIFAVLAIVAFFILIHRWITRPLNIIAHSLNSHDPAGLSSISPGSPEFYAIAELVSASFAYRKNLENEISERKKAEERILKDAEELKEINTSKDKFFSIVAHDLKSPFHYLLGYADLLRNEYSTLSDEDRKKFVGIIHSNSRLLYNLLENLLEWSRLQMGKIDFEMEVFDLSRDAKQLIGNLKVSAAQKRITLDCSTEDQSMIKADRNMIRSAIHNLLSNAIKYTRDGGLVSLKIRNADSYVELNVYDTGIGMTPDEVARLFRIDVSSSKPGTNKEPGTGLGLILAKEFIEKNGGSIFIESEINKGSHFRVTLPLYKA
jgi:signal transduction histidine kinase